MVNSGTISANGGTAGGTIDIHSDHGFTLNGTAITANGTGAVANGGTLNLTDGSVGGGGSVGGAITVNSNITANAGQNGRGGEITISTSGAGNTVTIGTGASPANISALGGTATGNGGTVSITSPGLLSENASINASARGNGNGGSVTLESNTGVTASGTQTILLSGAISANGTGTGTAGDVFVRTADGSNSNLNVISTAVISANSNKGPGQIFFQTHDQALTVSSASRLTGKVELEGASVTFNSTATNHPNTPSAVTATAGDASVTVSGTNSDIEVLPGATVSAVGNQATQAGNITLQASRDISVDANASIMANGSTDQSGGVITLIAGQSGQGMLRIDGKIQANGSGIGNGGTINLNYASAGTFVINGSIRADGLDLGQSGEITIKDNADADMNVQLNGTLTTATNEGTPASLVLEPFNKEIDAVKLNIGIAAVYNSKITTDGRKVDISVAANNVTLLVHEISAEFAITLDLIGTNETISLPSEKDSIRCNGVISLEAGTIRNAGFISISEARNKFETLNLSSPTGNLNLINSGKIEVLSSKDFGGTIRIASLDPFHPLTNVSLSGDSKMSAYKLDLGCGFLTVRGNILFTQDIPTHEQKQLVSPINIDTNGVSISTGSSLDFMTFSGLNLEIPFVTFKELTSMTLNGSLSSAGYINFVNQSTGMNISGTSSLNAGSATKPSVIGMLINGAANISLDSITGTVIGRSRNGIEITTARGNLTVGSLRTENFDLKLIAGQQDSVNSKLAPNTPNTLSNINGSIILQEGINGSIIIDSNVTLRTSSGNTAVGLYVGPITPVTKSLPLPSGIWSEQPTGSLGKTIFFAGSLPVALAGQNTLTTNNSTSRIYVVNAGSDSQITIGGADHIIAGLIPISFSPLSSTGAICQQDICGHTIWFQDTPAAYRHGEVPYFEKGELLVFLKGTPLHLPHGWELVGGRGTLIYLASKHGRLIIRNLLDNGNGLFLVNGVSGHKIRLGASQQLISSEPGADNNYEAIPERNAEHITNSIVSVSEYSLPYFLLNNAIMREFRKTAKQNQRSRILMNTLLKFSVAYGLITQSKGSYRTPQHSNSRFQ